MRLDGALWVQQHDVALRYSALLVSVDLQAVGSESVHAERRFHAVLKDGFVDGELCRSVFDRDLLVDLESLDLAALLSLLGLKTHHEIGWYVNPRQGHGGRLPMAALGAVLPGETCEPQRLFALLMAMGSLEENIGQTGSNELWDFGPTSCNMDMALAAHPMVEVQNYSAPLIDPAIQERQWVMRVRKGDEAALTCLIAKHRTRLVRTATNLLRDRHEAEDVAQEAFLKGFREIAKLRDDRAFSGYLYRICVRLCMDRLRLKRAELTEFDKVQPCEGGAVENKVLIEKLLAQLPAELRTTLVLREMEQLSYEEVAEAMRVPIGTVRSRLHTARERFRKLWIEAVGE